MKIVEAATSGNNRNELSAPIVGVQRVLLAKSSAQVIKCHEWSHDERFE